LIEKTQVTQQEKKRQEESKSKSGSDTAAGPGEIKGHEIGLPPPRMHPGGKPVKGGSTVSKSGTQKPKIFLIYGHDELALRSAEALLHNIGCMPIIFSKLPNKASRTN